LTKEDEQWHIAQTRLKYIDDLWFSLNVISQE